MRKPTRDKGAVNFPKIGNAADSPGSGPQFGADAARQLVSSCAGSEEWTATLSQLALNPSAFRNRIYNGVSDRGYEINASDIPVEPETTLGDVVASIQSALPGDTTTQDQP